jgi:hypothetical protein
MLSFRQFILEKKSSYEDKKDSINISDIRGKMHENLVHHILNGGRHSHPGFAAEHDILRKNISDDEYNHALKRANHAADHILKNIIQPHIDAGHKLSSITRTSKAGEIGEHQSDNPSDLLLNFEHESGDKTKHGLSLKTSAKKGKDVPISNPGMGTLKKYSGVDSSSAYDTFHKGLHNEYGIAGSSQSEKERAMKAHSQYKEIQKKGGEFLKQAVSAHAEGLHKHFTENPENKTHFLKKEVLRLNASHPVSMVTTGGEGDNIGTNHKGSSHFDHLLSDPSKISHKVSGNSIIFNHADHGDFAKMRFKYASRVGSSIKGSGEVIKPKRKSIPKQ